MQAAAANLTTANKENLLIQPQQQPVNPYQLYGFQGAQQQFASPYESNYLPSVQQQQIPVQVGTSIFARTRRERMQNAAASLSNEDRDILLSKQVTNTHLQEYINHCAQQEQLAAQQSSELSGQTSASVGGTKTVETSAFEYKEFPNVDDGLQYVISECQSRKLKWFPVTSTGICAEDTRDGLGCSAYLSLTRTLMNTSYVQGFKNHTCIQSQRPEGPQPEPIIDVAGASATSEVDKAKEVIKGDFVESFKTDILSSVKNLLDDFTAKFTRKRHKKRMRSPIKSSSSVSNPMKKANVTDSSSSSSDDDVFQENASVKSEIAKPAESAEPAEPAEPIEPTERAEPELNFEQVEEKDKNKSNDSVQILTPEESESAEKNVVQTVKPKKVSRSKIRKYMQEIRKCLEVSREEAIQKALEIRAKIPDIQIESDPDHSTIRTDPVTNKLMKKFDKMKLRRRRPLYTNAAGKKSGSNLV